MIISVTVKASAKREEVQETGRGEYRVAVNAPARDGKANEAVVKALAEYFDVAKSCVTIVRGQTLNKKVIEITS